jgi:hypothetical protein
VLGQPELGAERGNTAPEALRDRFFAHVPTQFADGGTTAA